ncbi:LytTR family transcriptional regulator DNA-binding domain-containing protein [Bacillus massiliigorillae]|uniref:LytTR family transcriptional regulator DNA-binding domain-containing protein n=1 Tax=Bacillus massiliigorillae TaxID=1243664 RepID=UPI00039DD4ED|nr:LytTR family transcriptional regulator DNA-binding domain-containing protein [Bacillus massiliigorillae]
MTLLSIKQLEKRNGNNVLFPPFDLDIHKGEIVAIHCNAEVGFQLIQMMIGKLPVSNGEMIMFDLPFNTNYKKLCKHIGIVLLHDSAYERLTPKDYLLFFQGLYHSSTNIDSILQKVGLHEKRRQTIKKLTYSEIKRLNIARAIIHQPELIIMEEPDQNVDLETKLIIKRLIDELASKNHAILITTSNMESAISLANKVFRLNDSGLKQQDIVDEEIDTMIETEILKDQPTEMISQPLRFDKIPAKVNDKLILFDPTEIDYIESRDGISHLFIKGDEYPCTFTLTELDERLHAFGFFRCHRSYIVNLQKVREVISWTRNSYSLILEDPKKSSIPLSKGKMSELKHIIGM